MTGISTKELKQKFIDFFVSENHKHLPSSSVIPENDPTLLFTNSGMVQFKNILLGEDPHYKRVCTVQRCIRAGGKHNDLDDVGNDTYHHTFFEMMGNWSFGSYFKEDAIKYAYTFLVNVLGLEKERLYVTIYEELDSESRDIWRSYLPERKIISASRKDNFWEMGEFGPCGPCTEIHYDRIGGRDAAYLVNKNDPSVIEIWNIVFMEYENTPSGLRPMEMKKIDTGIGLERLLSILNGYPSNYQIDTFAEIITEIEKYTDKRYTETAEEGPKAQHNNTFNRIEDKETIVQKPCIVDVAFRVVADHSRTIAVCLYDGVRFSNEGVGYVMRRIMRRAVRYAYEVLGLPSGTILQIVAKAAEVLDLPVKKQDQDVKNDNEEYSNTQKIRMPQKVIDLEMVKREETLFDKTLKKGVQQFRKMVEEKRKLDGNDIFVLYDTYGFPKDLTIQMAEESNVEYTLNGFDGAVQKARELSRKTKNILSVIFNFPETDDSFKYTKNTLEATLQGVVIGNELIGIEDANRRLEECEYDKEIQEVGLVFDKTPMYGELGGQVGDKGKIIFPTPKTSFVVENTIYCRGYVLHIGTLRENLGRKGVITYDEERRRRIRINHSATHIIYHFLRNVYGRKQMGSLVDDQKLRFDYSGEKLGVEEIENLEKLANAFVEDGKPTETQIMPMERVREILENPNSSEDENTPRFEKEDCIEIKKEEICEKGIRIISLCSGAKTIRDTCGGTHVENASDIRKIRIVSEGSVKAGVRRLVAVAGDAAYRLEENAMRIRIQIERGENVSSELLVPFLDKLKIEKDKLQAQKKAKNEKKKMEQYVKKHADIFLNHLHENEPPIYYLMNEPEESETDSLGLDMDYCTRGVKHLGAMMKKSGYIGCIGYEIETSYVFYLIERDGTIRFGIHKGRFPGSYDKMLAIYHIDSQKPYTNK